VPETKRHHHVLIAMTEDHAIRGYGQRMLDGIIDFARHAGDWRFRFAIGYRGDASLLDSVDHWDGVVGLPSADLRKRLENEDRPAVLGVRIDHCSLPQVYPNDPEVGRMGYRYLRGLGFVHLAFLGYDGAAFSDDRRDALAAEAAAAGLDDVRTCRVQFGAEAMADWVASLKPPTALFCANVQAAHAAALICEQRRIRVPQDLAILGCDDDPHLCELTWPPLSTVDHGSEEVGYRAAEMLDTLMRGRELEANRVVVPPVRVIERQSTNTLAIEDEAVAAALHFIRARACDGIEVADVLKRVAAPRRTLEKAFRKHVDRGIREEIVRVRIGRAAELLVDSDLPTPDIAVRSGFSSAGKLSTVFGKATGLSPTQYRRRHRH
jgi:LacI family transcriptional regulator